MLMKAEASAAAPDAQVLEVQPETKSKSSRMKTKRPFPKFSIEEAREIGDAIKLYNAGKPWAPQEIAKALKTGAKTSYYFYLTAASRDYGLTIGTRDTEKIELAPLGTTLAYPKNQAEEAKAVQEAFRNIDLFKKVYDYYEGQNLPEIQYLKNTLKVEFGVDELFQDGIL
jgi:hypothetical protein